MQVAPTKMNYGLAKKSSLQKADKSQHNETSFKSAHYYNGIDISGEAAINTLLHSWVTYGVGIVAASVLFGWAVSKYVLHIDDNSL